MGHEREHTSSSKKNARGGPIPRPEQGAVNEWGSAGKDGNRNGRSKKDFLHNGRRHPIINERSIHRLRQPRSKRGDKVAELLRAHQKNGILRLRLAGGSDFFAKTAGVFTIHDLINGGPDGFTAGEISKHRCPCDALQNGKVSTNRKKQRHTHHRASDDTDGAEAGQHGVLLYEIQIPRQDYP